MAETQGQGHRPRPGSRRHHDRLGGWQRCAAGVEDRQESRQGVAEDDTEADVTDLHYALVAVVAVVIVAVAIFVLWVHHMVQTHGALVLFARWHLGRALDGKPRTDATFFRAATKKIHPQARDSGWHWRPHWQRTLIVVVAETGLLLAVAGLFAERTLTLSLLAVVVAILLVFGVAVIAVRIRTHHHIRHYVAPLERTVTAMVGTAPETLAIERSGGTVESVTIEWAPTVEIGPAEQQLALEAVTTRLPIENPAVSTSNMKGRNRTVTFAAAAPPPTLVTLEMVRWSIGASGPDEIITGIGRRNTSVPISLDKDSAHIALSIGPGGGKSRAARAMAIQVLFKGGLVVVLNAKKSDYNWTRGLPNVCHAKKIGDSLDPIADMLLWLNTERMRREDIADAEGDIEDQLPDHVNVGPRIFIIFEEMNLTVPYLKLDYPEAFMALGDLNFAGRSSRMNMVAIAQRYSAKAAGGGDVRAAVNAKILGRYDKDAWLMLAKAFPMPPPNMTPGRVQVVTDEVHEVQMPKVGGQEAHDFALSGTVAICPSDMPSRCLTTGYVPMSQLQKTWPEQPVSQGQGPKALPPRPRVSLREACDDGVIALSYEAARKRRTRDRKQGAGEFPADAGQRGTEVLHYLDDLIEWEDRRTA